LTYRSPGGRSRTRSGNWSRPFGGPPAQRSRPRLRRRGSGRDPGDREPGAGRRR
jgi:hypothetical protein